MPGSAHPHRIPWPDVVGSSPVVRLPHTWLGARLPGSLPRNACRWTRGRHCCAPWLGAARPIMPSC
eukprot:jgi/Mesvir1/8998/Mv25968-RA.1